MVVKIGDKMAVKTAYTWAREMVGMKGGETVVKRDVGAVGLQKEINLLSNS